MTTTTTHTIVTQHSMAQFAGTFVATVTRYKNEVFVDCGPFGCSRTWYDQPSDETAIARLLSEHSATLVSVVQPTDDATESSTMKASSELSARCNFRKNGCGEFTLQTYERSTGLRYPDADYRTDDICDALGTMLRVNEYPHSYDYVIDHMRDWLCDCYGDETDDIQEAEESRIIRIVRNDYDGGITSFLNDVR